MGGEESYNQLLTFKSHVQVVITTEEESEFRVVFNNEGLKPSRGTSKKVLCFVIGQHGNTATNVREGNPGVQLASTRYEPALLPTNDSKKPRSYWFYLDIINGIAAFGLGDKPSMDTSLLVISDWRGCFAPTDDIFIGVANWKTPINLRMVAKKTPVNLNTSPHKFNLDRSFKHFPGVTCICRVNEDSHGNFVAEALTRAQKILKEETPQHVGGCFAFLPPDSFHMTIADLVTPKNRDALCPGIHGDMKAIGQHLHEKTADITAMAPSNLFYLKMNSVSLYGVLAIELMPYEPKTALALASWRHSLFTRLGIFLKPLQQLLLLIYSKIGFPYSMGYVFHITLAYRVLPINDPDAHKILEETRRKIQRMLEESKQFDLIPIGSPELCSFDDMSAFHKVS